MADCPTSAVVRVVAILAASSCGEASRRRVSTSFMTACAQNLREEEEQDEEDGDDACEKHPATPAIPGAVTVVAVASVEIMSAQESSAYRMTSASADLLGRNKLTGCSNHNTDGVQDSFLRLS